MQFVNMHAFFLFGAAIFPPNKKKTKQKLHIYPYKNNPRQIRARARQSPLNPLHDNETNINLSKIKIFGNDQQYRCAQMGNKGFKKNHSGIKFKMKKTLSKPFTFHIKYTGPRFRHINKFTQTASRIKRG